MQLLILILKKVDQVNELIKSLAESGVKGGTILEGTGMAESLVSMEDLPIFSALRRILADEPRETSQVMLFVLRDEQITPTTKVIKQVIGDLNRPNTGIMFTVPISYVEGLGEQLVEGQEKIQPLTILYYFGILDVVGFN